ncbi:hypothetical protein ACLMJK_004288 [Lecanora helva]
MTTKPSTGRKVPKLRDSCDACAIAKVKCTKKKPTCTRCDRRGFNCEYNATKRAGRPSQSSKQGPGTDSKGRLNNPQNESNSKKSQNSTPSTCKTKPSNLDSATWPNLTESAHVDQASMWNFDQDDLASSSKPTVPSLSPSAFTAVSPELDDILASLGCLPKIKTDSFSSLPNCSGYGCAPTTLNDTTTALPSIDFPFAGNAGPDVPSLSSPARISHNHISGTFIGDSSRPSLPSNDSICNCLMTILGFLQDSFSDVSEFCTMASPVFNAVSHTELFSPSDLVILENEQILSGLDSVLECSCSQDGYLLNTICLIVFKVLDRYAAAARSKVSPLFDNYNTSDSNIDLNVSHLPNHSMWEFAMPSSSQPTSDPIDNTASGERKCGGLVAQTVLGELHRAQKLVDKVSARLKGDVICGGTTTGNTLTTNSSSDTSTDDEFDDTEMSAPDGDRIWPFSADLLDHLEADLRRRLRTVSSEIVDMILQR